MSVVPPSDTDVADVLLKEYETLRAEILQRVSSRDQLFTLLLAAVSIIVATDKRHTVLAVCIVGGVGLLYWLRIGYLINLLGSHVASIEDRVNELMSAPSDEKLLTWETKWGRHLLSNRLATRLSKIAKASDEAAIDAAGG